ncbi:MAG: AAA family ATPase [Streptococcus mitis]|jgi:hypothetical protein|uniref:AAA family ATPase n=1 Tax=Streptococcus sp. 959 TaxID=2582655 RepID=UPI001567064C|nr:AAA family ATPase [Streptococcus sp. 959]MDU2559858.1 AAA family ATPase [Streptococcus mitis]
MTQKLLIDFEDTLSTIELPLGDNVVLFGENGTGKTRVLKTINSIIELSKVNSDVKLRNILKDLNIKNFKINNIGYDEIFQVKDKIINKENENFIDYFKQYSDIFRSYVELKSEFLSSGFVLDNFSNSDIRQTRLALEYFEKSDFPNNFRPNLIRRWIRDMSKISVSELQDESLITVTKVGLELKEYERFISQIVNNYVHSFDDLEYYSDPRHLKAKKRRLRRELATWSSMFISINEIDFEFFFTEIRKQIHDLQLDIFSSIWDKNGQELEIINKINKLDTNVEHFNSVIKRYFDLKIVLDKKGEFHFYKSDNELRISKFSSGERNVIFLFLKLIFTDADIYLIDEPEVSLSLSFQKRIIGDIFDVVGDKKVIIATHAPYIYKDFKAYSEENKVVKIER